MAFVTYVFENDPEHPVIRHDVSDGVPRLGELVQVVLGKALPNPLYLVTKVVTRIPAPVSVVVFLRRAPFGTEV